MHLQQNHCHPTWQHASRFLNILSFSAQGLTTFSVNYTWLPGCCTTRSTAAPHVLWGVFESENRTLQAEHDLYLCGVTFYFSFQRRCSQVRLTSVALRDSRESHLFLPQCELLCKNRPADIHNNIISMFHCSFNVWTCRICRIQRLRSCLCPVHFNRCFKKTEFSANCCLCPV